MGVPNKPIPRRRALRVKTVLSRVDGRGCLVRLLIHLLRTLAWILMVGTNCILVDPSCNSMLVLAVSIVYTHMFGSIYSRVAPLNSIHE